MPGFGRTRKGYRWAATEADWRYVPQPATIVRSSARPAFHILAIEPGIRFLLDIDEQVSGTILGCRRLLKRRGSLGSDIAGRVNDTKSWDVASHIA
jgi:hypothetical protein